MTDPGLRTRIAGDPYASRLGIELLDLAPGRARTALTLAPDLHNFHGLPHGGAIFSLADAAFAAACNAGGEPAVALTVNIQFLAAVSPGTRLVAEARATREGRRAGFYGITVTADDGTVVATCQAVAIRKPGAASPP
jgi:acyl-CoA thioesterase